MNNNYVIRFTTLAVHDEGKLRKLQGEVDPSNFVKILDNASLDSNPRDAKKGTITEDILETLEVTPELFHYKSKGVLLSSTKSDLLDRNRIRLYTDDPEIEGILDGGHNSLAISLFLLSQLEEAKNDCNRIKRWKDLKEVWPLYSDAIKELLKDNDACKFLVPVEIITTKENSECNNFVVDILDIAQARNNNAQLTEETKAHKAGYYDELKKYLTADIRDQIEWRANDGGRIKARDIVAFAMIPLSKIVDKITDGEIKINPVDTYSSKGQCVKIFSAIYEHNLVSEKTPNGTKKAANSKFISALKLTADIPAIYDMLLKELPEAYNDASPGYGRINSVGVYDPQKAAEKKEKGEKGKYLKKHPLTKFSQEELDYESPEGFIVPLLWGIASLIEDDGKELKFI